MFFKKSHKELMNEAHFFEKKVDFFVSIEDDSASKNFLRRNF